MSALLTDPTPQGGAQTARPCSLRGALAPFPGSWGGGKEGAETAQRSGSALRNGKTSPTLRAQRPPPPGTQLYSPRPPLLLHPAAAQGWNVAPDRPAPAPPPVTLGHSVTHAHTRPHPPPPSLRWMDAPGPLTRRRRRTLCRREDKPVPHPRKAGVSGGAELGVLSDKCSVVGLSMLGSTTQYREELQ